MSMTMEFWPGIYSLAVSRISNVYLVVEPTPTLIDTGPPGALPRLLAALQRLSLTPRDLRRIVLTHCDVDHIGNAAALQRLGDLELCAHRDDLPFITERAPWPGPPLRRAIHATWGRQVATPRIDRALRDDDRLDDLTVLHLPGHTPGHIGLQRGRALLAGDLVMGGRRLRPSPSLITSDREALWRSLARVGAREIDLLLPGHGTPVNDGAAGCAALVARHYGAHID